MTEWIIIVAIAIVTATLIKIWLLKANENNAAETHGIAAAVSNAVGIPQEYGPIVYYAANGFGKSDKEYRFKYKKVGGSWRAYILRMPALEGRSGDGHSTHRHWDGDKPYICWNSAVKSLHDMQSISRVWADSIQEYIATGKRFG